MKAQDGLPQRLLNSRAIQPVTVNLAQVMFVILDPTQKAFLESPSPMEQEDISDAGKTDNDDTEN